MPDHPDALDDRLRTLTRQAFDDAVHFRRQHGRLTGSHRRLWPLMAAVAVAAVVAAVATLVPLRLHQAGTTQTPAVHATPTPLPTAGALPAQTPLTLVDPALEGMAVDAAGNIYLAEGIHRRLVKVGRDGVPSVLAGPAHPGSTPREGGPAATGIFGDVLDVAVDRRGNVYVLDSLLGVRRVSPDGTIATLARVNGTPAFATVPDGGGSIAVTASGTVYVACGACHPPGSVASSDVYAIAPGGAVRVVAGGGHAVVGAAAAGLSSAAAGATVLGRPLGVAVDTHGNVFIADTGNNRIREIGVDGHVGTVAGDDHGKGGSVGDGGPATDAELDNPVRVAVDAAGDLFILERPLTTDASAIRMVSAGVIRTFDASTIPGSPAGMPAASDAVKAFFANTGITHFQATGPDGYMVSLF